MRLVVAESGPYSRAYVAAFRRHSALLARSHEPFDTKWMVFSPDAPFRIIFLSPLSDPKRTLLTGAWRPDPDIKG